MQTLFDYAKELAVIVEFTDLSALKRNGQYCHELRLIQIQDGMMQRKTRHTFAHELAHATFQDEPSMLPHVHRRQEDRADEWAAHFLIEPQAFQESEERNDGKLDAIAIDLHVLEKTVRAYIRTLDRIGDTLYIASKMGRGQWSAKLEVA